MNTKRLAWVYPGQGSQFVGMGQGLAENSPRAHKLFETANEILGHDLTKIMFEGPEEELKQTINTQAAVLICSVAVDIELRAKGLAPAVVAGHSLGEYAALYGAGVLDFETVLRLVKYRSELMADAGRTEPGTMAAIIGFDDAKLKALCEATGGAVVVANYNAPRQTVISGTVAGVTEMVEKCKEAGAKRAVTLPVSGAFHSPLMREPARLLAEMIAKTPFADAQVPVITNADGLPHTSGDEIRALLVEQMTSSVLWTKCMAAIQRFGVDAIVEVGPGKVLAGLMKRIDPEMPVANVGSWEELEVITTQEE